MLFAGGRPLRSLGDIIDDTDPCTLNPNDPVCVAFKDNGVNPADIEMDPPVTKPPAASLSASLPAKLFSKLFVTSTWWEAALALGAIGVIGIGAISIAKKSKSKPASSLSGRRRSH